MADTTTELEVLDQIVDVLGGQSGQYETVVPVLQQIKELLASGITDPESIAEAVTAWLDEHPEATTTVQDGSITVMKLAQDVIGLLENKADIDGYYSQLTAGLAENLIGRGDAVPAEYLYRTAGGTADIEDGIATIDCIKGNALVWNQMLNPTNRSVTNGGITFTMTEGGFVTISGTATANNEIQANANTFAVLSGHKYLVSTNANAHMRLKFYVGSSSIGMFPCGSTIVTATADGDGIIRYRVNSSDSFIDFDETYTTYLMVFDLTLMFGAGNEPATVEEFEAMFHLPYYPYSAPKMLPVDMRGIETVGFNAYNPSTGEAELLGGHQYQISGTYTSLSYSTGESIALDSDSIFTPSENGTLTVTGGNATDTCVHLVWSGYRNGEYEEHWSAERPIDTSRFFPTGLKKVGDKADALYADHYDTVVGAVDLGTLTWTAYSGGFYSYAIADALAGSATNRYDHITCAPYTSQNVASLSELSDKCCSIDSGRYIQVKDSSYTTAADFTAAMSGVMLYYELATPTTTPIDPPLNLSYKVSDFGTERIMVDETADAPQTAPVPMEVEYGINAIDTIRRLPKEYQSHKSMGQLTAALESSLGIDITETWDEDDQRYEYEVSDFELVSTVASVTELDTETVTTRESQEVTKDDGYHWNGSVTSSASYFYAHLTGLQEGDVVTVSADSTNDYYLIALRFVDAYSGTTRVADACANNATETYQYVVPSGIDNIYVSCAVVRKLTSVFFVTRVTSTETLMPKGVPQLEDTIEHLPNVPIVQATAQTLESGTPLVLAQRMDNKKNCTHTVWAEFDQFDTLTLAHGNDTLIMSSWIVVDLTKITPYYSNGSTVTEYSAYEHGLTISDFVAVTVEVGNTVPVRAKVTVTTASGTFTQDNVVFGGSNGTISVSATMDMENVKAQYVVNDMLCDVFLFGDSYVGISQDRYPYQVMSQGHSDFLVSGYSGAASASEVASFDSIIAIRKPKFVVWALGMNDQDKAATYNERWKEVLDHVLATCAENGITPILATIPNVPSVSNVYKNEWVRQSGYRYVDFAKAVGAEESGSTWYSGMLYTDNVHPTELGAKALAARFLIDVPEVL